MRESIALRPYGEEFKPFFVRYRSSLNRADAACSSYMTVTTLFYRGYANFATFRFLAMVTHQATPGATRNGSNHIPTISAAMLRSYTGLGCSTCATPCETVCNRPTVFTERPLLTSALAYYGHLACARHTLHMLSHALETSFRVRLGFFAGSLKPRSIIPFTCTRAFAFALSHSRATLAVIVRLLAPRLGVQFPIHPAVL